MSETLQHQYKTIISELGENPEREGLLKTPERAAKAMRYMTKGYKQDLESLVNGAVFSSDMDEMVTVENVEFYSMCEHHLLPFFGRAHIAYIPDGKVLGLSKFARIVDMYARRFQIQENMTRQIAQAILDVTGCKGVGVVVEGRHMCMMMRGVEKQQATMKTSVMLGSFRDSDSTRNEFLSLIRKYK